jgi:hypothetical protein
MNPAGSNNINNPPDLMGSSSINHNQNLMNNPYGSDMPHNDEIVISAAMQQLRDPGVLIVAHGSRGKPKTVRLQLTETAITWRTETRKKAKTAAGGNMAMSEPPKMGKLHQVPLSHMWTWVNKQQLYGEWRMPPSVKLCVFLY